MVSIRTIMIRCMGIDKKEASIADLFFLVYKNPAIVAGLKRA